uniref:acetyl-CoA C-acyltransferase n=1 Tax=Blastobotrys adeninivorans TaxID=409370 RepID=A0A060T969_BLAAD
MDRLNNVASHLSPNPTAAVDKVAEKRPDDVVITAAYRTPITKGGKGGLKDMSSGELVAELLKGLLERSKVDPKLIEDVAVGNVLNAGAGANEHRAACLVAGIPNTTPLVAINRQCSSGLMAVNDIATKIAAGQIDIGIGGGVEAMSQNYGPQSQSPFPDTFKKHSEAAKCLIPMGFTSENVAKQWNISREEQDRFAAESYQKAAKAQDEGLFDEEIIPINAKVVDDEDESKVTYQVISKDDGIRRGTTKEKLGKLKPAFDADGTTTAGNASQVSDGAGAVLLMRRSTAEKLGQKILAKFVHCKVVGVPPEVMGIGPGVAVPALLKATGLTVDDVDIFEINEAFASQVLQSLQAAGIPESKVNPKGGAIAFGHPLGATGARQVSTLLTELKRTNKRVGVTSMCIGSGMGAAALFIRE